MNIDNKYQNVLCDLLSLFQEALIRFLTKKPIDVQKFKRYFGLVYGQMLTMQDQFHQQKVKFTKCLTKIQKITKQEPAKVQQVQTQRKIAKEQNKNDCPPEKPFVRYKSAHKTVYQSHNLNSIQEEEEEYIATPNNVTIRRSGTAGGTRNKMTLTMQNHQRPMTGTTPNRAKLNKTINHQTSESFNQERYRWIQTISAQDHFNHEAFQKSLGQKRKSFYDQLEKQKVDHNLHIAQQIRIPFRKKHSVSQKKWAQKINRFL